MLSIGQKMNGYTIVSITQTFAGLTPDGAVILGTRPDGDGRALVVATVEQRDVDAPEPARFWRQGYYFEPHNTQGEVYPSALAFYLRESGAYEQLIEHARTTA